MFPLPPRRRCRRQRRVCVRARVVSAHAHMRGVSVSDGTRGATGILHTTVHVNLYGHIQVGVAVGLDVGDAVGTSKHTRSARLARPTLFLCIHLSVDHPLVKLTGSKLCVLQHNASQRLPRWARTPRRSIVHMGVKKTVFLLSVRASVRAPV
eukprot:gene14752-biopygen17125